MTYRIKGIPITLIEKEVTGHDPMGNPVYGENPVEVQNVLVAPTNSDDVINAQNLIGRTAVYTLGIPKGDNHNWENQKVIFFGQTWRTFGIPTEGIEDMIPLDWNKKVMVERYE